MSLDYDLIAHTCSSQEIARVMKEQEAEIARLKELLSRSAKLWESNFDTDCGGPDCSICQVNRDIVSAL